MAEALEPQTMTRRQVAKRLGIHQDSVSRLLPDGLGGAIYRRGGRGKPMLFVRQLVDRWEAARHCYRDDGRPCFLCRNFLESAVITHEHYLETGHVFHGCEDCTAPWLLKPVRHGRVA